MFSKPGTNFCKKIRHIIVASISLLVFVPAGSAQISGQCMASSGSWANSALSQSQTGTFLIAYDAIPSIAQMDAVSGLSSDDAQTYTDLAVAVRFNSSGMIDVRNGSEFTAANSVPYSPRTFYHFILDVNIPAHTYNAYVVVGGTQTTLGSNLAFRTEQSTVTALSNVGLLSFEGLLAICNVTLSAPPGTGTPTLNASTSSLNFGQVGISGSSNQTVTLTNVGSAAVTISQVSVAGAGFTAGGSASGVTVAPSQSVTVSATFAPPTTGNFNGTLTVNSNATNAPLTIGLSGTGSATPTTPSSHSVALSWNAGSSGVVGYNVYVSSTSGGPYSRINSATLLAPAYLDSSVQSGQTYYFVVTSVNSANQESAYSAETQAVIP